MVNENINLYFYNMMNILLSFMLLNRVTNMLRNANDLLLKIA